MIFQVLAVPDGTNISSATDRQYERIDNGLMCSGRTVAA